MKASTMTNQDRLKAYEELQSKAADMRAYWERHGSNPSAVERWAVSDLLGILRFITELG